MLNKKKTRLDEEISRLETLLGGYEPYSDGYADIIDNLDRLYKLKNGNKFKGVSADTLVVVGANLLGIAIILWHEKAEVITSKAFGFVLKGRV